MTENNDLKELLQKYSIVRDSYFDFEKVNEFIILLKSKRDSFIKKSNEDLTWAQKKLQKRNKNFVLIEKSFSVKEIGIVNSLNLLETGLNANVINNKICIYYYNLHYLVEDIKKELLSRIPKKINIKSKIIANNICTNICNVLHEELSKK